MRPIYCEHRAAGKWRVSRVGVEIAGKGVSVAELALREEPGGILGGILHDGRLSQRHPNK